MQKSSFSKYVHNIKEGDLSVEDGLGKSGRVAIFEALKEQEKEIMAHYSLNHILCLTCLKITIFCVVGNI